MPRLEGKVVSSPVPPRASVRQRRTCSAPKALPWSPPTVPRVSTSFPVDAGSEADVERLVEQTVADHGRLDIMFANAGVSGGFASIFEQSSDDWAEILRVNLIGPFLAIKYAAPHMKAAGGGSIIATASVAGNCARAPAGPAYSASKAGVS